MSNQQLFDTWTEQYDQWFIAPVGQFVKQYESDVLLNLLDPQPGECILDVGCGTGIFTADVLKCGANITGIDLSFPMVHVASQRLQDSPFIAMCANMCELPFPDNSFDRLYSMTAIEFVPDAALAIAELERVTRKGGSIVVTTLNSLSPWADKRKQKAKEGHSLFAHCTFRSPVEMQKLIGSSCVSKTAVHFQKNEKLEKIPEIEQRGREQRLDTGALLAVQWIKS